MSGGIWPRQFWQARTNSAEGRSRYIQWQFWELIPTWKGRGWANSARPVTRHQQQSKSQLTGPRHSVPAYSRVFYALTPNIQTDLAILIKLNIFWQSIKMPVLCIKCVINFRHNILKSWWECKDWDNAELRYFCRPPLVYIHPSQMLKGLLEFSLG